MNFLSFENYIFDFDGVVLDSNRVKGRVFQECLSGYPRDCVDQFLEYNSLNGGVSRDKKFEYFLREIMKLDDSQSVSDKITSLVSKFGEAILNELLNSNLTDGVEVVLKKLNELDKQIYIWTGGRKSEVCATLKQFKLINLFKDIYGAPGEKDETLDRLISENNLSAQKTIIIGDSISDFEGARKYNMSFLFVSGYTDSKLSSDYEVVSLSDLSL